MYYKYVYVVVAYEKKIDNPKIKDDYIMFDQVAITIYANSVDEALEKAKNLITKPLYRIHSITEYEDHTKMQEEQLKIQSRMADSMDENHKKPWEK